MYFALSSLCEPITLSSVMHVTPKEAINPTKKTLMVTFDVEINDQIGKNQTDNEVLEEMVQQFGNIRDMYDGELNPFNMIKVGKPEAVVLEANHWTPKSLISTLWMTCFFCTTETKCKLGDGQNAWT
jgi:hypothetical protein